MKWTRLSPGFTNASALRGYSDDLRQQEIQIRPELNLLSCGNTFFPSHSGVKVAVGKPSGSVIEMLCRLFERLSPTGIIVRDLIEIWPLENRRYVVDQRPYQHQNGIGDKEEIKGQHTYCSNFWKIDLLSRYLPVRPRNPCCHRIGPQTSSSPGCDMYEIRLIAK